MSSPLAREPKVPNKHQLASVTTPATNPNLFPKLAQTGFGDEFGVPLTPGNKTTFSWLFFFFFQRVENVHIIQLSLVAPTNATDWYFLRRE